MAIAIPLGITSYTYRWAMRGGQLDAWKLIDRTVELGLQVLQYLDNVPLDRWPDDDLRALRRAAEGRLTLQVGMSGLDPQQLSRYIEVAGLVGADLIRVTVTTDIDTAYGSLTDLLPRLRAAGVTVAIENHFDQRSDQLAALMRRIADPHVAICLDTLRHGTAFRIAGTALGEGLVDLPSLVRAVWAAGRRPPMLLEAWQDPAADEAATLAAEQALIERSIAYMRELARLS